MSSRIKHTVATTKDRVSIFTCQIAIGGVGATSIAAAPSGTIVSCTDESMVTGSSTTHQVNFISGTQNPSKIFTVTFPENNRYRQLLGFHSDHGAYIATPAYKLRILSASGEGFQFAFTSASYSATSTPTPVCPLVADGVTGSFTLYLRDTDRTA